MQLSTGDRLGHYEVLSPLGKGGMGEVYRARDLNLKRDVAIKVLPTGVAGDPERLARFRREAEILASLNHPGIASIYGIVENALVMELVEGETLPCPVPIETAVAYAKQIVDAVEYAHDRGVIHRDLKPDNIKVTPEGMIKILDFGLAKALDERAAYAGDPGNSPTLTMGATQAGVIMGTAAYMSPEQAVGKTADRRADIFSFGVVLYELLTGKRAFQGETVGETLAAVAKDSPDWSALPSGIPNYLRDLLERMLAKDRRQRLQAIGEARLILEKGEPAIPAQLAVAPPKRWPWAAAAALCGLLGAGATFAYLRQAADVLPVLRSVMLPPEGAEFSFGSWIPLPTLSPDGSRIVFGARVKDGPVQLWVRRLDSLTAQPLPGTENASAPFWSPDGRWIAFGQDGKLKKIDIQGGPPITLTSYSSPTFRGGSWSEDGVIVFAPNSAPSPILQVPAEGGKPTPATVLEQEAAAHRFPHFLPDGRHFLYLTQAQGDIPVWVGSLDAPDKPGKRVATANSPVAYAQGHLLFLRENTLMAQPFDADKLETTGEPIPVAEGIPTFTEPSRAAAFTVSTNGLLVYSSGGGVAGNSLLWKDRQGKLLRTIAESQSVLGNIALSPDRKRLAAQLSGQDIWIYDVERGIPSRLTFGSNRGIGPVWSPDGKTVFYGTADVAAPASLLRKAADNSGAETVLLTGRQSSYPTSVSPDGKWMLFHQNLVNQTDLMLLPLDTSTAKPEPRPFLNTSAAESRGVFSPDGKWVAYTSTESGMNQVYIRPFPGPGGQIQVSAGLGTFPRWRADGKELYFQVTDVLMAAQITPVNGSLQVGRIEKLFDGNCGRGYCYDVSADGQRFIVVSDGTNATSSLTLVQNWPATLRK